jgi:lipopolysaccharide export system protein LptC
VVVHAQCLGDAPRHDPDYIVENFRATDMDDTGRPKHELSAIKLVRYSDDGSSELDKPYLIQHTPGQAPTHIRADKGYMPKQGDRIRFSGDVRLARGRDPKNAGGEIRTQTLTVQLDR